MAPLWSLSYEAGYYLLFGAAMFLRGATDDDAFRMVGRDITLLLSVSVLCFGFAALFERRLGMILGVLRSEAAPK